MGRRRGTPRYRRRAAQSGRGPESQVAHVGADEASASHRLPERRLHAAHVGGAGWAGSDGAPPRRSRRRHQSDERRRRDRDDAARSSTIATTWPRRCSRLARMRTTARSGTRSRCVTRSTDWRARDGSRLRADHPNKLTGLGARRAIARRGSGPRQGVHGPDAQRFDVLRYQGRGHIRSIARPWPRTSTR